MTEPHTTCPVCNSPVTQDSSIEGTQSLRPAGLTMQELREWLQQQYTVAAYESEYHEWQRGRINNASRANTLQQIIAIIDEGKLPE